MQAKRFFFEKKKQKTFIHCRRHGVRTENSVPSETDKSFLVLFCKKERVALLRFQWVDLPGQLQKRSKKLLTIAAGTEFELVTSAVSVTDKSFLILAVAACDPLFLKKNSWLSFLFNGLISLIGYEKSSKNLCPFVGCGRRRF